MEYRDGHKLVFHDFIKNELEVMISREHPLASKDNIVLQDLEEYPIIQLKDDPYTNRAFNEALGSAGFTVSKTHMTDNYDTVPLALLTSNAFAVKPVEFTLSGYDDLMVNRKISDAKCSITRSFVYRKDNDNATIPVFIHVVEDCFK